MDLNSLNRLRYHFDDPSTAESQGGCEQVHWIRICLDSHINTSRVLRFAVPPDAHCFTDPNSIHLKLVMRILRSDGELCDSSDQVFMGPMAAASVFRSSQVFLNGYALEPNTAYSMVAALSNYLSMSTTSRTTMWQHLAGVEAPDYPRSGLRPEDAGSFIAGIQRVANSKHFSLVSRLHIDALNSMTQLIPPGFKLEIELNRAPDSFPICSMSEDKSRSYRLEIETASLFCRRVRMAAPTLSRCLQSLSNGGQFRYNRLATAITSISPDVTNFTWSNVWNNSNLPFALYLVFIDQSAWNGDLSKLPNYFETAGIVSVNFRLNGRDIMPEPYRCNFQYLGDGESVDVMASEASEPYLGLVRLLNSLENPNTTASLSFRSFVSGAMHYSLLLNSCGGRRMEAGSIDLELQFDPGHKRPPLTAILMGEYDRVLRFDSNLNIITTF